MTSGTNPAETTQRSPARGSFLRSAAFTYAANLSVAALSLVNVLIVSRALGPQGRGDVAFLTAVAMITASLSALGVRQATSNIVGLEPERRGALATNAVLLSLILGAIGAGCVALLVGIVPAVGGDVRTTLLALALASIPVMILRDYLWGLVTADYGFAWANASWLIGPLVNVVVNGSLAASGSLGVGSAVATWIGGQAVGDLLLIWYVRRRLAGFAGPDLALVRRTLSFGLKAHLGMVLLVGNYRLDQWLVGSMSGSEELGLYSVAVAWGEGLFFLPTALALVQRPDLIRAPRREDAGALVAPVFRMAVWITLMLSLVLALAAPFLCSTIFGAEFDGSINDLRLLVPGGFGIVALKLLGQAMTAQGHPLAETLAISTAFVSTLALDIVLIPHFGGAGAALASTLAYCIGGVAAAVIFARVLRTDVRALVPRPSDLVAIGSLLRRASVRGRRVRPNAAPEADPGAPSPDPQPPRRAVHEE